MRFYNCTTNKKLVFGWGINDVDYPVVKAEKVGGNWEIVWSCPYYLDWKKMLERCLYPRCHIKQPTYRGCTVCDEWRYLSNFIKWVDSQPNKDWKNCQLDKDFLVTDNKHYSPDCVVYITQALNKFLNKSRKGRGRYMIGVSLQSSSKKTSYKASCNNPFTTGYGYLGLFTTELEAHKAWQSRKHEYACMFADMQEG